MSTFNNNDFCQHTQYCALAKNVCPETNFKDVCCMKDAPIDKMSLLTKVKERMERDIQYKQQIL